MGSVGYYVGLWGYCVGVVWIFGVFWDFGGGVVGGIEYFWVGVY